MYELSRVRAKTTAMEPTPNEPGAKATVWFPLFGNIVILAALGLCTWAMTQARTKGRELPGGTTPPTPTPPPATDGP
jgi:hypothetical protein